MSKESYIESYEKTFDNKDVFIDADGDHWRVMTFSGNATCKSIHVGDNSLQVRIDDYKQLCAFLLYIGYKEGFIE